MVLATKFHAREPAGMTLRNTAQSAKERASSSVGTSERRLKPSTRLYKSRSASGVAGATVHEIDNIYSWADLWPADRSGRHPPTCNSQQCRPNGGKTLSNWIQYLDIDAEPCRRRSARQDVAHHGSATFQGLDLFWDSIRNEEWEIEDSVLGTCESLHPRDVQCALYRSLMAEIYPEDPNEPSAWWGYGYTDGRMTLGPIAQ